jgi:hypothetical protein
MKKEVLLLILVGLFIFTAGVLAQEANGLDDDASNEETEDPALAEEYVRGFVEKSDFAKKGEVNTVSVVNQSELPEDIQIKEIDENNVGIFEVNYTDKEIGDSKKIFVVTYAAKTFKKKEQVITKNIQNLFFGIANEQAISSYLETANGVQTGENTGYVMLRSGSITGISTTLELSGNGKLFIRVYKNGEDTGFHNLITSEGEGTIDFDLQSEGIVNYKPGDVISVYVQQSGTVAWKNVVTTVETTS